MPSPRILVLAGYGINCEEETAYAFELSGAKADIVHVNDLIAGDKKLDDYQIFAVPGGFAYGDDTGAGKAMANKMYNNLREEVFSFVKKDTLTLAICNGFQVITALGLVPALDKKYGQRQAALMANESARYTCRWVYLKNASESCVFTKGIEMMYCPIAHGEGKFYMEERGLDALQKKNQVVFEYVEESGAAAQGKYPANPNGSLRDIAGVCDPSGRILGMMPHPERALFFPQRPDFSLRREELGRNGKKLPEYGDGKILFDNAVRYFG